MYLCVEKKWLICFIKNIAIYHFEEERNYKIAKIKLEEENEQIRLSLIRDAYDEAEKFAKEVTKDVKKNVQKYISSNNKILEPLKYYKEFMDVYIEELAKDRIPIEQIKYIKDSFAMAQRKGKIEMEDLAPLMYIKYMVHGIKTKFELKHIVIDEAQDFSEFQFYIFKKIVKSNSLTILGDLSQGIYFYRGTNNWQKTMSIVFGEGIDPTYLTLKKTYRTTEEIMNVANKAISHLIEKLNWPPGEPVMKNGAPVIIKKFETQNEMQDKIKEALNNEEIHVISNKDSEYNGGINIVPSYLSKGLEFDAVIITNADTFNYTMSEVDTKLLYVCATRAMNTLEIYHVEELTKLLQ